MEGVGSLRGEMGAGSLGGDKGSVEEGEGKIGSEGCGGAGAGVSLW